MLHSGGVGQKSNLTSDYPRAFRFAKRCLGGRGGVPLFDGLCADSRPSLASAGADASLRAGWLGWLIGLSVGAEAHIGPLLGTTCVASVERGDLTPPPDALSCSTPL